MKKATKTFVLWAVVVAAVASLFAPAMVSASDVPTEYPQPTWGNCYNALTH